MPDYVIYDVEATAVSPVHIGSGTTLLADYDYVIQNNSTWRLDLDALLEEKIQDERHAEIVARVAPGTLFAPADFVEGSPLFRYVLRGAPRAQGEGAQLQEQVKDARDRPFLPGSSLKGALRTAVLWCAVQDEGRPITVTDLVHGGAWAAERIEQAFLRQGTDRKEGSPNYDLLRALHVGDSEPVDPSALRVVNASVIGGRSQPSGLARSGTASSGAPIELEAIRPNTSFRTRVKIDTALFSTWAQRRGLHLESKRSWVEALPQLVNRHSSNLAERGLAWCSQNTERKKLEQFYQQIRDNTQPDRCFVQVGWGGGWDSKTLGSLLQRDDNEFETIARRYHLRRGGRGARPGTPFPGTRRMWVRDSDGEVLGPLGWFLLRWTRRP